MDVHKYASPSDFDHTGALTALMAELKRVEADSPRKALAKWAEPSPQAHLDRFSSSTILQRVMAESKTWARSVRQAIEGESLTAERLHGFRSGLQRTIDDLKPLEVSDEDKAPVLDISARLDEVIKTSEATQDGTPERKQALERAETVCLQVAAEFCPALASVFTKVIKGYQSRETEAQTEARIFKAQAETQPQKPARKPQQAKPKAEKQAGGGRRHYLHDELQAAIEECGGLGIATPSQVFGLMEGLAGASDYAITRVDRATNRLMYFPRRTKRETGLTLDAIKSYLYRQDNRASEKRLRDNSAAQPKEKQRSVA